MPFAVIIIGVVILVTAFRNTHTDLATALETDVPGYFKWGAAIAATAGLGYIPGLQVISRYLLALVITVIVLKNYQAIIAGFTAGSTAPAPSVAQASPAAAQIAAPGSVPTQAQVAGGTGAGPSGGTAAGNVNAFTGPAVIPGALDPAAFLTAFEAGLGGFGGVA
jgi:hypothetical protein